MSTEPEKCVPGTELEAICGHANLWPEDHGERWMMLKPLIDKLEKGGIERQGKGRGDVTPLRRSGEPIKRRS